MSYIDPRTYDHVQMYSHHGKSLPWRNGYRAGYDGKQLPGNASEDYRNGYSVGGKDRERQANPPHIRNGLNRGNGFDPSRSD